MEFTFQQGIQFIERKQMLIFFTFLIIIDCHMAQIVQACLIHGKTTWQMNT